MAKNTFALFGIFAVLLLSLGLVSADIIFSSTELSGTGDHGTTVNMNLNLENDFSGDLTDMSVVFTNLVSGSNTILASNLDIAEINSTSEIAGGENMDTTVSVQIPANTPIGTYTGSLELFGTISSQDSRGTANITITVTNPPYNFCEYGTVGTLAISDFEISNLGDGDEDEWELLDEIEIEVEIENTDNSNDVRDVMVELMILDDNDNDVTKDFDLDEDEFDLGKIRDDDSELVTFRIPEIPADIEEGDYRIYVKAYKDNAEDEHCVAQSSDFDNTLYQTIEIIQVEDPAVVIKDKGLVVSASCGDKGVTASFYVYNLGSDKEEKVLVTLRSSELELNEGVIIDDLRSGKREEVIFTFDIPEDLTKSYYKVELMTHYDYDDDEDELDEFAYDENSDEDLDEKYYLGVDILSCSAPEPSITADLESESIAGTELVIKATITNNGEDNNFVISASGFESWADLVDVSPQTLSIDAGESTEAIITLMPTKNGFQTFQINTIVDGETHEQSVSVNITPKPSLFAGIDNTMLYAIAVIAAVLIIIFLILIIKVSKRQSKPQF